MPSSVQRSTLRERRRTVAPPTNDERARIAALVRQATGLDLRAYKSPTIKRRILRRVSALNLSSVASYIQRLRTDRSEALSLYEDSLIHVTGFFRDPLVFRAVSRHLDRILARRHRTAKPIRVWVPGCSTGEEVYSYAIALLDSLGERSGVPIQIFGTDVSEPTLAFARKGFYATRSLKGVSASRLKRYFTRTDGGYQISKAVRSICTFARQDVVKDPPFSHIDLISCRNLLIYLAPEIQNRVVAMFHYALMPDGLLVMGRSESIGPFFPDLFDPIDQKHNIFRRKSGVARQAIPVKAIPAHGKSPEPPADRVIGVSDVPIHREAERLLLSRFVPPSVLVNGSLDILHTHGELTRFLRLAAGKPSLNILKMARDPILVDLRIAIERARRTGRSVRETGLVHHDERRPRRYALNVIPVDMPVVKERYFLVAFEEDPGPMPPQPTVRAGRQADAVTALRRELASTRAYLQSLIDEHEQTVQELRSANEEILSSNEELQSTNEEMVTAKEELESTNEELTTVNEELALRNAELKESLAALEESRHRLNEAQAIAHIGSWLWEPAKETMTWSDELYRINGIGIEKKPLSFARFLALVHPDDRLAVEKQLRRSFSKKVPVEIEHRIVRPDGRIRIINKLGQPVTDRKGRVIAVSGTGKDVTDQRAMESALQAAQAELENRVRERTAQLAETNRNLQSEIAERRRVEQALRRSERQLIDFYDSAPVGILWIDAEGRVARVNQSLLSLVDASSQQTIGRRVRDFFKSPSDADDILRRLKAGETISSGDAVLDDGHGGRRHCILAANTQSDEDGRFRFYRWFLRDDTARKAAEDELRRLTAELQLRNEELRHSNEDLEQFAYVTSHDLQEPLRKIYMYLDLIKMMVEGGASDKQRAMSHIERIQTSALRMRELIEDLLNFSRIKAAPQTMEKVDLNAVLKDVVHDLEGRITDTGARVQVDHLPAITGNRVQMRQLFQNLIGNSIKFTEPGRPAVVQVSSRRDGFWYEIRISDNGIGFEEKYLDRIFKPFQRLHGKERYEGTGIGLAICHKIVLHHNGAITATSRPGQGSTFVLKLPARNGTAEKI